MTNFTSHSVQSAPEASKAILQASEKKLGFVPDLFAKLAESPTALKAYTTLGPVNTNLFAPATSHFFAIKAQ